MTRVSGKDIHIDGKLLRIARLEGDGYEFIEDPEPMLDELRECGFRIDLFTFVQKVTDTSARYRYPMEWDNFAALHVTSFDSWWKHQLRWEGRNRARQAEKKGVTLRTVPFDDTLVEGIWGVYNESPVRQGKRSRHYGKDFRTVCKEAATFLERSVFIGAFFESKMIGFAKLVIDETSTQANLMNIVSMVRYKDKAPTNALIAQSVRCCAELRIPYLLYNNFSYGKKERDGAVRFKENNGFQRIDVPRYYVPLTGVGRTALRLGLHRGLAYHIPEFMLVRLRQLRKAWYTRKYQPVEDASKASKAS